MNGVARLLWLPAALILAPGCSQPPSADEGSSGGALEGVWSVVQVDPADAPTVDPAQPGVYIFAEQHYSAVYTPGPEPRIKAATSFLPTTEEMVAQYQSIIVNSGTYELDGSSFTLRPMIAKSPGFVGGRLIGTYALSGDTLVLSHEQLFDLDGVALADFGEVLTLVRLE